MAIKYKNYIIEPETDLWAIKYGSKFKFYHESGEVVHSANSVEEAKEMIDDGFIKNDYDPNPDAWSGGFCENH